MTASTTTNAPTPDTAASSTVAPQSVAGRLLAVLDAFDGPEVTLRLSCIATRTGLPAPTAWRMVRELLAWGGLERHDDGSYRLGQRLWVLGAGVPCLKRVRRAADPQLRLLRDHSGLVPELAVRDADAALLVAGGSGDTDAGTKLALHASAVGKVLLAGSTSPADDVAGLALTRYTVHTVTDPRRLLRQLGAVWTGDPAGEHQELKLGRASVAVAVRGPSGATVAALGLTAGTPANPVKHLGLLRRAATNIARSM